MAGKSARFAAPAAAVLTSFAVQVAVLAPVREAAAQGFPATLAVEGQIAPSSGAQPVVAASSDELVVINKNTGGREPAAFSIGDLGNYLLVITKESTFNGTALLLRLRKGGNIYSLLEGDGSFAEFQFFGSLFAERIEINLRVGPRISSSTQVPPVVTKPPAPAPKPVNTNPDAVVCLDASFDVNGDGKCDEADIAQIQEFLRNNPPGPSSQRLDVPTAEDVNRDGTVNARDILDSVRALLRARVEAARTGTTIERGKLERPAAPERPASGMPAEMEAARTRARERP